MDKDSEIIFEYEIPRITKEKLKNIVIRGLSISPNNYHALNDAIKESPQIDKLTIIMSYFNETYWNNFFSNTIGDRNKGYNIDISKLYVCGDLSLLYCDIFEDIQNIDLPNYNVSKFTEIQKKFPNLKNVDVSTTLSDENIKDNPENVAELLKYTPMLNFETTVNMEAILEEIKKRGLEEKFIVSDDKRSIVNIEKFKTRKVNTSELHINIRDLEKIGIDSLKDKDLETTLIINDTSQLSVEQLEKLRQAGINIKGIKICTEENKEWQKKEYKVDKYIAIREKLDELVDGIDLNLPEKERFAEVYKRICKNIVYDNPAAYPKTKEERAYKEEQTVNCRNLTNGLLEGKCVCAGYADILRNALAMVGIESKYISGGILNKKVPTSKFDASKLSSGNYYKTEGDTVAILEAHAWNKVKLDGVWYNVDATWDATDVRLGKTPSCCLKTDEQIVKKDKKLDYEGPECVTEVDDREIDKLFGDTHFYIGKRKVPSIKDIIVTTKNVLDVYADGLRAVRYGLINITDFIKDVRKGDRKLLGSSYGEDNVSPKSSKAKRIRTDSKETENTNEWDLNRWGIKKDSFARDVKKIANNSKNASKTNDEIEEQEK